MAFIDSFGIKDWDKKCWISFILYIPRTLFQDPFDWRCSDCGREW